MEKIFLIAGLMVFTAFTIIPLKEEEKKKELTDALTVSQTPETGIGGPKFSKPVVKNLKDTIPAKNRSEIDFKQISTNVNISDNTKTETITAFDPAGKKYTIVKVNNKLTSLQIDDKNIPENEIGKYSSVISQIGQAIDKKQEGKMKEMEAKRAQSDNKKIGQENNRMKEKNKMKASDNKSKEEIKKNIEAKRKMLEADRKVLDKKRNELADVKKEITVKKQELESKEGKEKDAGLKEIKIKEKLADAKLKEIENRKKVIENKKQEIGEEKEKLEKIKEKENKAREKGEGNGKGEGEGRGEGKGEGQEKEDILNSKKIFKENSIASRQEIRHTVDRNIFKKDAGYKKAEEYKSVAYNGAPAKKAELQAPGWRAVPSKPLFKIPRTEIPRKENRIK